MRRIAIATLFVGAIAALAVGQTTVIGTGIQVSGIPKAGNCAKWTNAATLADAGTTCGGGSASSISMWHDPSATGGGSGATLSSPNAITMGEIDLYASVVVTHLVFYIKNADASGNYDIGIYDSNGNLKADIGPTHFTSTGYMDTAIVQTSVTLPQGEYFIAWTGTAVLGQVLLGGQTTLLEAAIGSTTSATTSTGGQLPAAIAIPSLSFTLKNPLVLAMH